MKYCCEKLEIFIKESNDGCGGEIISKRDKKYFIVNEIRSCDDGEGYVDTWVDERKELNYCPFCGRKL